MKKESLHNFFIKNSDGFYLSRLFIYGLIIFLLAVTFNYVFYGLLNNDKEAGYIISIPSPEYDPLVYHWSDTLVTITLAFCSALIFGSFLSALVFFVFIQSANILKLIFIGSHASFSDLFLVDDLFFSVNLTLKIGIVVFLLGFFFAIFFFFSKRLLFIRFLIFSPVIFLLGYFYFQPTATKNYIERNDYINSLNRDSFGFAIFNGPLFTVVYKTIYNEFLKENFAEIEAIKNFPEFDFRSVDKKLIEKKPNIHILVLESFLNPNLFSGLKFNKPPVYGRFGELEKKNKSASFNTIKSTGAAEFEVLCGIPNQPEFAERIFNVLIKNKPLFCLPNFLKNAGYFSIATHPNISSMYNRKNVYQLLGFDEMIFSDSLDMHDRDDMWLNDMALLEQNIAKVKNKVKSAGPILNYVLTVGGHYPYNLDKSRPPLLKTKPDIAGIIYKILQVSYYTSMAVDYWIREIEKIDPNSIILIVSDHLPYFVNPTDPAISAYTHKNFSKQGKPLYLPANQTYGMFIKNKEVYNVGNFEQFSVPNILIDGLTSGQFCKKKNCTHKQDYIIVAGQFYDRKKPILPTCNEFNSKNCSRAKKRYEEYRNFYMGFLKNSF